MTRAIRHGAERRYLTRVDCAEPPRPLAGYANRMSIVLDETRLVDDEAGACLAHQQTIGILTDLFHDRRVVLGELQKPKASATKSMSDRGCHHLKIELYDERMVASFSPLKHPDSILRWILSQFQCQGRWPSK